MEKRASLEGMLAATRVEVRLIQREGSEYLKRVIEG